MRGWLWTVDWTYSRPCNFLSLVWECVEWATQAARNRGWGQLGTSEFIAMLLPCCSVFLCWHSEHVGRRVHFFYRSHATSQWSIAAGPLQTNTVEHALPGSAKHGHLGESRCNLCFCSYCPFPAHRAAWAAVSASRSSHLLGLQAT